ncbi:hypothetical protein RHGRI_005652 [Rhododendron griersonianum]|uniref:Uncharacterized protein n=1 Tax=Rhododendron griersonianum TaxID=479676 RepID=A0AAV6LEC2_9ERIC|nr:hypothetical protein RHGRI_005652 [Rhododendron griersonianum]KAG5562984.1 hypothetical protein RHGRI_005652 [Rhododendron griersonianum]
MEKRDFGDGKTMIDGDDERETSDDDDDRRRESQRERVNGDERCEVVNPRSMMSSISMLSLIPEIHIAGGGIGVAFCKSFYMNRNPDCPSNGRYAAPIAPRPSLVPPPSWSAFRIILAESEESSGPICWIPCLWLGFLLPAESYAPDFGMFQFCITVKEHDWREGTEQYNFVDYCLTSGDKQKQLRLIFLKHKMIG